MPPGAYGPMGPAQAYLQWLQNQGYQQSPPPQEPPPQGDPQPPQPSFWDQIGPRFQQAGQAALGGAAGAADAFGGFMLGPMAPAVNYALNNYGPFAAQGGSPNQYSIAPNAGGPVRDQYYKDPQAQAQFRQPAGPFYPNGQPATPTPTWGMDQSPRDPRQATNSIAVLSIMDGEMVEMTKRFHDPNTPPREKEQLGALLTQYSQTRAKVAEQADARDLALHNEQLNDKLKLAQIDALSTQTGLAKEELAQKYGLEWGKINEGARQFDSTANQNREKMNWQAGQNDADRTHQMNMLLSNLGMQEFGIRTNATTSMYNTDKQLEGSKYGADRSYDATKYNADQSRASNQEGLNYNYWATGQNLGQQKEQFDANLGQRRHEFDTGVGLHREDNQFQAQMMERQAELTKARDQYQNEFNMKLAQMQHEVAIGQLDIAKANQQLNEWATKRSMELSQAAMQQADKQFEEGRQDKRYEFDTNRNDQRYYYDTSFGEGKRQFDANRGDRRYEFDTGTNLLREQMGMTNQRNALGDLMKLREMGYNPLEDSPEYETGGAPGGSIGAMMSAFGYRQANPNGYTKPTAKYDQMAKLASDTSKKYGNPASNAFMSILQRG